jgi:hypothetical protein
MIQWVTQGPWGVSGSEYVSRGFPCTPECGEEARFPGSEQATRVYSNVPGLLNMCVYVPMYLCVYTYTPV